MAHPPPKRMHNHLLGMWRLGADPFCIFCYYRDAKCRGVHVHIHASSERRQQNQHIGSQLRATCTTAGNAPKEDEGLPPVTHVVRELYTRLLVVWRHVWLLFCQERDVAAQPKTGLLREADRVPSPGRQELLMPLRSLLHLARWRRQRP